MIFIQKLVFTKEGERLWRLPEELSLELWCQPPLLQSISTLNTFLTLAILEQIRNLTEFPARYPLILFVAGVVAFSVGVAAGDFCSFCCCRCYLGVKISSTTHKRGRRSVKLKTASLFPQPFGLWKMGSWFFFIIKSITNGWVQASLSNKMRNREEILLAPLKIVYLKYCWAIREMHRRQSRP